MRNKAHAREMSIPTNSQLRLGRFHRYPARFGVEVVEQLLDEVELRLGSSPSLVLDPFSGSGTTLAAARRRGVPSAGVELSRLGVLITQLRLDPPSDLPAAVARLDRWVEEAADPPAAPLHDELEEWLGEVNVRRLGAYLRRMRPMRDERERRFATVALSGALRPASRWLPGSIKPQIESERTPPDIGRTLKRVARQLAADCRLEPKVAEVDASIFLGTALKLPLDAESVSAVVTSPPYYVTYDYLDVQRLTYLALGWEWPADDQIGRRYYISPDGVGFVPPSAMKTWYSTVYRKEQTVLGRALRAYLNDMEAHLREVECVLEPHGVVAYAVGNSKRAGKTFNLAKALAELMVRVGFDRVEIVKRQQSPRRILPAGRDGETGRFSMENSRAVDERVVWGRKAHSRIVRRRPS